MNRPPDSRAVLVVHLFHEDVAIDLLRRIADLDIDVIATGPRLPKTVAASLARLKRADFVEAPNEGFDVLPFLSVLPLLSRRGYDLVCKLHTKRGASGFGRRWLDACVDGLVGSGASVAETIEAFRAAPDLAMVGPAGLYLSAAANMTANGGGVRRLAPLVFPALELPQDWGFFAGTMFWTRVAALKPFAALRSAAEGWEGGTLLDGGFAHAVERLFGLIPVVTGGRVGLRQGAGEPLAFTDGAGAPLQILQALARLGTPSPAPRLTSAERAFIAAGPNPLVRYLTAVEPAADPNPLFAEDWYARQNALPAGTDGLSHFLGMGSSATDPSPLFRAASYVKARPWLRRRNVNALLHHAREVEATDGAESPEGAVRARPHSARSEPFGQAVRRQQLAAFIAGRADHAFTIKIATSRTSPTEWGDVHFARGLADALAGSGSEARIDYREDWYRRKDPPDVVIALRGPVRYEPRRDAFNILWVISHPDQVSFAEMEEYDLVYVASDSFASLLRHCVDVPVLSLLQATDAERFRPSPRGSDGGRLFFAGNTRGIDRPVVRWASELGLPLGIYGSGWAGVVPDRVVKADRIANAELPARYGAAPAVLNDHWPAMVDFGFVSNRLFDVIASGGTPITDTFPAISAAVGSAAIQIETPDDLVAAVSTAVARPSAKKLAYADRVRRRHSFAVRSATILADLDAASTGAARRVAPGRGRRVHIAFDRRDAAVSWSVTRRLLGPLTTDQAGIRSLSVGSPDEAPPATADLIIAVPGAPSTIKSRWDVLLEQTGQRPIVVDTGSMGSPSTRPAAELRSLLAAASQIWLAGGGGTLPAKQRARSHVVPDSVDPRLWRDHHAAPQWDFAAGGLRCVLVAENGLGPELAAVLAGAFAGDDAHLTVIEPSPSIEGPWQSQPFPAGKSGHAAFARWLRAAGFHAGVWLGTQTASRQADLAFLDFSAAGLLTIAPALAQTDPAIGPRALIIPVEADGSDLATVIARVAEGPGRYAGIAAASTAHVWQHRSAAAVGALVKRLLA